jgi:hypothetical protein
MKCAVVEWIVSRGRQPVPNFSETGFSLFRSVMRLVNWKRKWLGETPAANHTTQIIILNFELVGMSCLWNIAVLASNEVVAGQAISMLNELYQNLGPTLHDRVREKREEYVKNCMHYMLQVIAVYVASNPQANLAGIRFIETAFLPFHRVQKN